MAERLAKHGSEVGYRAELTTDSVCERCRKGHNVFDRISRKARKGEVKRPDRYTALDHLWTPATRQPPQSRKARNQGSTASPAQPPYSVYPEPPRTNLSSSEQDSGSPEQDSGETRTEPSLADRMTEGLRKLAGKAPPDEFVPNAEPPDYIHESEPDPDISGEWSEPDQEYVINKAGMELIEDNLGTYLSVLGITLEMIDPYCGPILAENFDNIIGRWTRVIARYPRAAKLFMSKDGGTLMVWVGAIQSTWPVLMAIYEHHLAKSVQTDNHGRVFKVTKPSANGPDDFVDATTPPMQPEYDYTVN